MLQEKVEQRLRLGCATRQKASQARGRQMLQALLCLGALRWKTVRARPQRSVSTARAWHAVWALLIVAMAVLSGTSAQARDLRSIGVLVGDLDNPFFHQVGREVEAEATKLVGKPVRVTVVSSGYDLERQVSQIDKFIASGYDLLILNAVDTARIAGEVQRAQQAGIVVVAVDVDAEGADATVTSDNIQAGNIACGYLATRLKGRGDVVILNGPPVSAVIDRVQGCEAKLSAYPNIHVLSDDQNTGAGTPGGLAAMTTMLTTYPHIDAVFAINDPAAIGADNAAAEAHRDEFFIVSVDGSPDGIRTMKEPQTRIVASVAQSPFVMADQAVGVGYRLLQGGPAPRSPILLPVQIVTKDNLTTYQGWQR